MHFFSYGSHSFEQAIAAAAADSTGFVRLKYMLGFFFISSLSK